MSRLALSLFACSVLATGVVGMAIYENSEIEPAVDARFLQASASVSASVSALGSVCGSFGCLIVADILSRVLVVNYFPELQTIYETITAITIELYTIALELGIILPKDLPPWFQRNNSDPRKGSKMGAELAETISTIVAWFSEVIADFIEARADPNVGEAFDEQICAFAEIIAEMEVMLGGRRRVLKAKTGKGLGFECPEIKSGKSGKTYSPSPTTTTLAKSGKSYYSDAKMPKMPKMPKMTTAPMTLEPSDMKSLKSAK